MQTCVLNYTDSFNEDIICFSLLTIVLKEKAFSVLLGYLLLAKHLLIFCFNKSRINFKLIALLKQEEYVGLNSLFCMIVSYISIYHNVAFPSIEVIWFIFKLKSVNKRWMKMPKSHEDKHECQVWGIVKLFCNNLWKEPTEVRRAYRNSSGHSWQQPADSNNLNL